MNPDDMPPQPMHEPLAELERELVSAYVAGTGHTIESLVARDDAEARAILAQASLYASSRLTEVESRLHYLQSLKGQV